MKILFTIFVLCFFSLFSFAQNEQFYFGNEEHFSNKTNENLTNSDKNNKFNTNISFGANFLSFSGQNIFYNYIKPEIKYTFSEKFSLSAGSIFINSKLPNLSHWNYENNLNKQNSINNIYFFMKGSYIINEKLRVNATSLINTNSFQNFSNNFDNSFYSLGFDYKITENSFISAEINIYKNNHSDPVFRPNNQYFYDNPLIRPLGNSLFSEPFPLW